MITRAFLFLAAVGGIAVTIPLTAATGARERGRVTAQTAARMAPPASAAEAAARFVAALGRPTRDGGIARQDFPWHPYEGRWTFVRIHFNDRWGDMRRFGRRRGGFIGSSGGPGWAHDYPSAEHNFSRILQEITYVRALQSEYGGNILTWDDPRLFQFPVAYVSEPGQWSVTEEEAEPLRAYLLKGGFVIFDDFQDTDIYNLAEQMARVFPALQFLPLDGTEAIFDSFFKIDPFAIVLPMYGRARPEWWGLFVDNDKEKRMLAIAGNNSDLGEYWEFSDRGYYPVDMSNEAYKVGVNYIVYAMTH